MVDAAAGESLSQGMIATAEDLYAALAPDIDAGRDAFVTEPSGLATVRREHERFLPADPSERLADASHDVTAYVSGLLENGGDPAALRAPATGTGPVASGRRIAYHRHCQARTVGVGEYATAVFERLGYDVRASETERCGMAGSFGSETDSSEPSTDVGEPLREQFGDTGRVVVAPGTSCPERLAALLDAAPPGGGDRTAGGGAPWERPHRERDPRARNVALPEPGASDARRSTTNAYYSPLRACRV